MNSSHKGHTVKRVVFGILLMLLLSACPSHYSFSGELTNPLNITVSKTRAAVGEPVTVTLAGGFVNVAEFGSSDFVVPNFRLGACFRDAADLLGKNEGGLCLDKDLPLPPYIVIAEGQSYQKAFGRQVVKSGEEAILKHTFSFTSTEPGPVRVSAMSQIVLEGYASPTFENSLDVEVQFE